MPKPTCVVVRGVDAIRLFILDEIKNYIFFSGFGPNLNRVPVVLCAVPPKTTAVYLPAAAISASMMMLN